MIDTLKDALTGFALSIFLIVFFVIVAMGWNSLADPSRNRVQRPRRSLSDADVLRPHFNGGSKSLPGRPIDASDQLRAVMAADFRAKRGLSKTEARVMEAADAAIVEAGVNWRVMAQVALGEVLACDDEAGFYSINAKRVDLLIINERSQPIAAIEYQGQGHYQGTAPARDAIKKEALRKAGVGYVEITHEHGPSDVRREIARLAFVKTRDPKASMQKIVPV